MGHESRIGVREDEAGGTRLWRLFGLGTRSNDRHRHGNSRITERARLLEDITEFLLRHDLPVSPDNLLRAHAIMTKSNLRLANKVIEREEAGEPVTQSWLDQQITGSDTTDTTSSNLDRLARELDRSMERFGESTRSAQEAASDYGAQLAQQTEMVANSTSEEDVVASLAQVARAMLDRTREMEAQMKKSDEEARDLRRNLAKARRDATIDHLTNLPNRRAFEDVFKSEWMAAQAEMEPLCLALCDIDFFKAVNDTHGHDTGDRVIRAVAQALDRISDSCHVARHGGEEFVLLFRGLDLAGASAALDAARERFAARHFVDKVSGKAIGGVTFSGGLTDVFAHPDLSSALRSADEALYRAKEAGRNRVEVA
ncbi:GGDEF domain-containing protein [Aurantiacibacter xanthus]|uniref:diguanylate cyclase n=1 Tax=Aurantiacibacter xanthus TaxID=1784712 RepID=A0A3A1P4P5_9SPHN|nr:GGDEF domain-containing protein [Aurantiacibacter xanthus]RIV84453.1 GGDEF domain-containing protein [Aurantiacibacter xanthus]